MQTKIKMPRVGENVSTVFVVEISDLIGKEIHEGDVLISVETDKATVEVVSPVSGTLIDFLVKIDDEIAPGTPYATIETS